MYLSVHTYAVYTYTYMLEKKKNNQDDRKRIDTSNSKAD
jgi:hypothetical protein